MRICEGYTHLRDTDGDVRLKNRAYKYDDVAKILPATYQIESLRNIFMTDSNLNNSLLNLVIQLGFTILFFTLAVRQVKKDSKC